jgi:hypothetical protein
MGYDAAQIAEMQAMKAKQEQERATLGGELLRAFDRDVPRREVAAGRQEQEREEVSEGV